jgi:hypothetical protein
MDFDFLVHFTLFTLFSHRYGANFGANYFAPKFMMRLHNNFIYITLHFE